MSIIWIITKEKDESFYASGSPSSSSTCTFPQVQLEINSFAFAQIETYYPVSSLKFSTSKLRRVRWSCFDGQECGLDNRRHDHKKGPSQQTFALIRRPYCAVCLG